MVVDTGIFIDHLRAKDKTNTILYTLFDQGSMFLSSISLFELMAGATNESKKQDILLLISSFTIIDFSKSISIRAADIFLRLKKENKLIDYRDIFIAASCVEFDYPILTLNKKHFQRIEGLKLANG